MLRRPRIEKIALFFIFGVGSIAALASVARLPTIHAYSKATDKFEASSSVGLWSMIELNIAIMCASVSAFKPLFVRQPRRRSWDVISGPSTSNSGVARPKSDHWLNTQLENIDSMADEEKMQPNPEPRAESKLEMAVESSVSRSATLSSPAHPPQPHPWDRREDDDSFENTFSFTPMSPPPRQHQEIGRKQSMVNAGMSLPKCTLSFQERESK